MTLLNRLLVVGWMVGGLFASLLAVGLPALLVYGVVAWLMGAGPHLHSLEIILGWAARVATCIAIWLVAKRAAGIGGPQGPSRATLALSALPGIAIGVLAGEVVRNTWGLQILSAVGLPPESFLDDIVTGIAFGGYGVAVFAATFLPRRAREA